MEQMKDLLEKLRDIEPATIGHFVEAGAMDPRIKPLFDDAKIVGRAVTVRISGSDSTALHCVMGQVGPGDVVVVDRMGNDTHACTGEVVALAAKCRGAEGIIIDGPATDPLAIREMNLPVFCTGISVLTTKLLGLGGEINVPIQCGGVPVFPGDIIIADVCGVLVLKPEQVAALAEAALKSEEKEVGLKEKLRNGGVLPELTGAANLDNTLVKEFIAKVRFSKSNS